MKTNYITVKSEIANLETLIPLSPMRFKRCGECGCAEHKGANNSGHSTACSKYNHQIVTLSK